MPMTPLVMIADGMGRPISYDALRWPAFNDTVALVAGTGKTLLVPTGAKFVRFGISAAINVFVNYSALLNFSIASTVYNTSSVSATGLCAGNTAEQNPILRALDGITGIGLIAPTAATVTLSFYG